MRRNVLLVDVGIAIVAAIVVLTITPGLAVASMIAVAVLAACAISFSRESRRRRRARDARAAPPGPLAEPVHSPPAGAIARECRPLGSLDRIRTGGRHISAGEVITHRAHRLPSEARSRRAGATLARVNCSLRGLRDVCVEARSVRAVTWVPTLRDRMSPRLPATCTEAEHRCPAQFHRPGLTGRRYLVTGLWCRSIAPVAELGALTPPTAAPVATWLDYGGRQVLR